MEAGPKRRRRRTLWLVLAALVVAAGAGLSFTACSPIYVIKAGIAEAKILAARRPIGDVILDPSTDPRTRDLLTIATEARRFAADELHLDVGDSYTSFTQLDSDTLAMVLSAAYRDRLVPKTWWFPIVGRVPYRGYFDMDDALHAQSDLEDEGFDTLLRPTAAFSTLGWFADPLLSTLLRQDDVELAATVIHELSHNHLFVPGRVSFNESYATFVGRAGAAEFFCTREGGGPDTVKCARARARWRDTQRYSRFLDGLVADLEAIYGDSTLSYDDKVTRRGDVFAAAARRFTEVVQPTFESLSFAGFLAQPPNNATLLSQMRYYHRLPDFAALLEARGGVAEAVAALKAGSGQTADPFSLLPTTDPASDPFSRIRVRMDTEAGSMVLELDAGRAPVTTANFLRYVEAGAYTGGAFFRTVRSDNQPNDPVRIDVVQGRPAEGFESLAPIPLERTSVTGLHHGAGAISMARDGPDTAQGEFFICLDDEPELDFGGARNPDGQGFGVFGRVIEGLDVARAIQSGAADGQRLRRPIRILSVTRVEGPPPGG